MSGSREGRASAEWTRMLSSFLAMAVVCCFGTTRLLSAQSAEPSVPGSTVATVTKRNGWALVPGVIRFDTCIGATILACPPTWAWQDDESFAYSGDAAPRLGGTVPDRISRARADRYFEPRTTNQGDVLTLKPAPASSVRTLLDPPRIRNFPRLRF